MGPRGLVPFTYDFYLNIQILNYLIMLKTMTDHKIGTREEWLAARLELLKAEKELTRRSDELAQWRQKLPWVRIDKEYRFEIDEGPASLADLFGGRSQLLVYHFMFGPEYTGGCPACTAVADDFNYDFNTSFTEEQQRSGNVTYNYRKVRGLEEFATTSGSGASSERAPAQF